MRNCDCSPSPDQWVCSDDTDCLYESIFDEMASVDAIFTRLEAMSWVQLWHEAQHGVDQYTRTIAMDMLDRG